MEDTKKCPFCAEEIKKESIEMTKVIFDKDGKVLDAGKKKVTLKDNFNKTF